MGAGTGAFALHAAKHCRKVYAVDVYSAMLERCRKRRRDGDFERSVLSRRLFDVRTRGRAADAMVSIAALHHLPDFWKLVALRRAAEMLQAGGRFFLFGIVFPSEAADLEDPINAWVRSTALQSGPELAAEAEIHIREEYST